LGVFRVYGGQNPQGVLTPDFLVVVSRRNHVFQIWWRSVQGFSVGWGSNFAIFHWLWWSSLQDSMCDYDVISVFISVSLKWLLVTFG